MITQQEVKADRWYVAELIDNKSGMDVYQIVKVFMHKDENGIEGLRVASPSGGFLIESFNFLSGPFTPQGVINMGDRLDSLLGVAKGLGKSVGKKWEDIKFTVIDENKCFWEALKYIEAVSGVDELSNEEEKNTLSLIHKEALKALSVRQRRDDEIN